MKKFFETICAAFAPSRTNGFALLYTVIVVSLILTIALSISNVSYKQTILSSLAKDSQVAFYQADAGVECALFYDAIQNAFGPLIGDVPASIDCGGRVLSLDSGESADSYYLYSNFTGTSPCFSLLIDKTNPAQNSIESRGLNTCTRGPRQVERALKVTY